ncbi:hypothetical protein CBF34_03300 [Vagococcus penaei]|uniref:Uncharacterized protein n=1 Tax=Vagococcus penaei TaxID=633807 RepID=A0A1Q2D7P3_9ENTE|nr:daptomycin-sensing surface protein LiaX [Vagococcus penaei]AQP54315.1 hypothetical protein BW732_08835 [Vagococcus penaei]RSU05797.1 hypothetical protein CBF34_03300 [Vagococcus penaei]
MQERERILELVKKGIITTEEALVLLENSAVEKDEKIVVDEAASVKKAQLHNEPTAEESEKLEQKYEALVEEVNLLSVKLDHNAEGIQRIQRQLREKEDGIMVINTMEELDELTAEHAANRLTLEADINELKRELADLEEEKSILLTELNRVKQEQKTLKKDDFLSQFDIPEDWKQQTSEAFNQVTDKVGTAGSQIGQLLKKTLKSVNDNIDWKDVNVKVPGLVSQSFSHEFVYPNNTATIISVKVANGDVIFKTWDQPDVKIESDIKLYGKMTGESALESFLERSHIDVTDEKIDFQVPNKRVKIDMVVYLPERTYDYMSVKMLNGDIHLEKLELTDVYLKTTNGDMTVQNVSATMVEVEGVNGDVNAKNSLIDSLVGNLMNGDISIKGAVSNVDVSLINGDIKLTAMTDSIHHVDISLVNGTIKVAVPASVGLDALVKTNLGSIKNRLENIDIIRESREKTNQKVEFRREESEKIATLRLATTTGTIYLKDTEN